MGIFKSHAVMLTIEKCRLYLGELSLTEEEVMRLRDFLYKHIRKVVDQELYQKLDNDPKNKLTKCK
jgi:hypothetical protein